jgi:16S rRNA (guanine966-N2)-methyltransferase
VRVIAGEAKGRRLTGPRQGTLRPTTDRVREALFSTLGPAVRGARVLDLFAGTGAVGIEALSRAAASAVFVDSDPQAVASIRSNLAVTGLEGGATVLRMTAEHFVARGGRSGGAPFDLVFLDPPYASDYPSGLLAGLVTGDFLAPGGEVVVELAGTLADPAGVPGLDLLLHRRYGDSGLVFLRPAPEPAEPAAESAPVEAPS